MAIYFSLIVMRRKSYFLLPFVLTFFLLVSCKSQKLKNEEAVQSIELEKTGCLRKCKTYKITVTSRGSARYQGIANVSKEGKYSRELNKEENQQLWSLVQTDSLSRLEESYNYGDEDTQQHFLKYYSDGKLVKEIRYGPFPPHYLLQLDQTLETIAEAGGWRKIE